MATCRTVAVVMSVTDYGESDKIVTLLCPAYGKLIGIAKGAKRSQKRFMNKLEIFTLLEIQYVSSLRSTMVRIDQAELVAPYPDLRNDYSRYAAATLICELTLRWTRENDGDPELFDLVIWALTRLADGEQIARTLILFQVKLLDLLGYQPDLSGCTSCGRFDAAATPYYFSSGRGGLICSACSGEKNATSSPLSLNTVKLLQQAQKMTCEKLGRLRFSRHSAREAITMLKRYDRHLLQCDIQSWNYIVDQDLG